MSTTAAGNNPIAVLCKMKSNFVYSMERQCLRPGKINPEVRDLIINAYNSIENAIRILEREEGRRL